MFMIRLSNMYCMIFFIVAVLMVWFFLFMVMLMFMIMM